MPCQEWSDGHHSGKHKGSHERQTLGRVWAKSVFFCLAPHGLPTAQLHLSSCWPWQPTFFHGSSRGLFHHHHHHHHHLLSLAPPPSCLFLIYSWPRYLSLAPGLLFHSNFLISCFVPSLLVPLSRSVANFLPFYLSYAFTPVTSDLVRSFCLPIGVTPLLVF